MNWYLEIYDAISSTGLSTGLFGDLITSFLSSVIVSLFILVPVVVIIWFLKMICGRY